ncbi:MAG: nitrate reductase molybdenum cofactor assembly chaperone [Betaproteobacteria bacterium]|nr:nitrate reductase molybdenum cofactor assembly chaperone [Betaproteobacteria bacterium]
MKTFKVLSMLLSYPEREWLDALPEMAALVWDEQPVPGQAMERLQALFDHLEQEPLLALQEYYVEHFDRNARCSLSLFEHVHGDSRERGQAMVDLMQRYRDAGLVFSGEALPDYLPVYLEYLSRLPAQEAGERLSEITHLLRTLGERLSRRASPYAALIDFLLLMAGEQVLALTETPAVSEEDPEAMDREWAEAPVMFGPGCSPGDGRAQVVHFHKGAGS